MKDEDGINSGYRNVGRLALWTIPLALAMGASAWIGVYVGTHDILRQLSQEQRRALYVGAGKRPQGKMIVETPDVSCILVTKVDVDGNEATVYYESHCHKTKHTLSVYWQLVAPDGTLLGSGSAYANAIGGPEALPPKARGEAVLAGYYRLNTDDRAIAIKFWVDGWD